MKTNFRKKRRTPEEDIELAIKVISDYNGGMTIDRLLWRHKIGSKSTLYKLLNMEVPEIK